MSSDQLLLDGVEPPPVVADFAQLRTARGLSVDEVAQQLKISPAKVRALEKLDFAQLPDGPYTRGFIRNYARLLDADPSPWLNLLDHATSQSAGAQELVRDDPRRLPIFDDTSRMLAPNARFLWWGVALLVVGMALFLAWWERARWQDSVQAALPETVSQAVSAVTQSPASSPNSATDTVQVAPAANNSTPAIAPATAMAAVPEPIASPITSPTPEAAKIDVPAGHKRLAFAFKSDAWIEVRDNTGKAVVSQLYKAGEQANVTGMPPLRFTVGAAREVALQVDGQDFDMAPHIKTNVARFVVN
jgi:cytoskeleton protein RodZ